MGSAMSINEGDVHAALRTYLKHVQDVGRLPSVAEFAEQVLGIKRPTLYSRFPDVTREISKQRSDQTATGRPRDSALKDLRETLAVVRRSETLLRAENHRYACEIRRLTLDNEGLRRAIEQSEGVSYIGDRREIETETK